MKWGAHSQFAGFEPASGVIVTGNQDIAILKDFYRQVRAMTQRYAPQATFVFHDAGLFDGQTWNDLFMDTHKVALDHHYEQIRGHQWMGGTQEFCDMFSNEVN
jgi:hypothetical protein